MNLGKVLNKLSTIFLYTRKYKNFMQKIKYIKYQEKKSEKRSSISLNHTLNYWILWKIKN